MGDIAEYSGMVISSMPISEFDKRIVLITKERGKISAFAKGARRINSPLMGVTQPFAVGKFQVYEGKTTYNIRQADISNYFTEITSDLENITYGCYFNEIADYYCREGMDASQMINLLYVSLKALANSVIPNILVRYIYELKALTINGEYPQVFECANCRSRQNLNSFSINAHGIYCSSCKTLSKDSIELSQSTIYTLQYIISSPIEKLYTFKVDKSVLTELKMVMGRLCAENFDKKMKSMEILETLT